MRPRILLTAFGPFGMGTYNPTQVALPTLTASLSTTATVHAEVLAVEFNGATHRLTELIREHTPDLVISLGLAEGRAEITPEKVAINLADARIPDESGAQPLDADVVANGPSAYFTTLPVKAMVQALTRDSVPAAVSYTAGTFVCNAVMYAGLHAAGPHTRSGFIHVPQATEAVGTGPSLPQAQITAGLLTGMRAALLTTHDTLIRGGAIS